MLPQMRPHASSLLIRSTFFASVLIAAVSAPSFAAPQPSLPGYFTATQDDVPYGEVPRQLVFVSVPNAIAPNVIPGTSTTIAPNTKNGLPRSLSIQSGGGGAPQLTLPGIGFVPVLAPGEGGELNPAVRSSVITVREQRSNTGFLDQTEKNVVNFSF